jgi:hypothetical protein
MLGVYCSAGMNGYRRDQQSNQALKYPLEMSLAQFLRVLTKITRCLDAIYFVGCHPYKGIRASRSALLNGRSVVGNIR